MKNLFFAVAALFVMASTGCSKDDATINTSITPANVKSTVSAGAWRVTNFNDSGTDKTADFASYTFSFGDNGVLSASTSLFTAAGTWSTSTDDSQTKLNIAFTAPDFFQSLTNDWHVIERTDVKVVLEDVSNGNGGTDRLTFEKN